MPEDISDGIYFLGYFFGIPYQIHVPNRRIKHHFDSYLLFQFVQIVDSMLLWLLLLLFFWCTIDISTTFMMSMMSISIIILEGLC